MRSPAYLAHVRGQSCCVCSAPGPSDPHHFGARGMAIKSSDLITVPLCRRCHDEWHRQGRTATLDRAAVLALFWRSAALSMAAWIGKESEQ